MSTYALVFALSVLAGFPAAEASSSDRADLIQAQAQSGQTYRRDDWRRDDWRDHPSPRELRRVLSDCHRDVRTHWINGARVTHRHVGDNCEVRIVHRSTVPND